MHTRDTEVAGTSTVTRVVVMVRVVSSVVVSVRLSFFDDDGHDRVEVVRWVVGRVLKRSS